MAPDLELAAREYLAHGEACIADGAKAEAHDDYIAGMIEQSVRKEAFGIGAQNPLL